MGNGEGRIRTHSFGVAKRRLARQLPSSNQLCLSVWLLGVLLTLRCISTFLGSGAGVLLFTHAITLLLRQVTLTCCAFTFC